MSAQNQHRELIIDTSVAVKFFVEEEGSDEAEPQTLNYTVRLSAAPMPHCYYPIGELKSFDSQNGYLICCSTATSFQTK